MKSNLRFLTYSCLFFQKKEVLDYHSMCLRPFLHFHDNAYKIRLMILFRNLVLKHHIRIHLSSMFIKM